MIAVQLNRTEVPTQPDSSMVAMRSGEKSSKVRKCGTDTTHIIAILGTMVADQRDHNFAQFGEAYFTYRKIVAGWIMDVGEYFCLHPTTTHAAVAYLDRLHLSKFSRHEWQMLAVSCILIAAKYSEKEEDVPDLLTLESILKQPIPNEILLKYEMWALQKMGWKLNVYTPLAFISCYVACGVCHIGDTCSEYNIPHTHNEQAATSEAVSLSALDARIAEDCYSLASIALLEMSLKPFKASDTAAAIIYYVRRCLKVQPVWSTRLSELTQTDPERDGFKAVYRVLADIFSASADKNTTSNTSAAAETTSTSHSDRESERERESSESEGPDPNTLLTPIKGANAPDSSNTKTNTNTNISANTIANTNIMTTPQTIRGPLSTCDGHDGTDGIRQALSCSTLSEGRDQHHRPIPLDDPTQPHGVYCTPTDDKDKDKENSCRLFLGPSPGSVAAMDSLEGV